MSKVIKRQATIVGRLHREIARKMTTLSQAVQDALIVGTRAFPGSPYDGHTLIEQVEEASILMQALDTKPHKAIVDLGYRGVDKTNPDIDIKHRGKFKSLTDEDRKISSGDKTSSPSLDT